MGGYSLGSPVEDLVLELARGPRMLFVPTPAHAPETVLTWFYEAFRAGPSRRTSSSTRGRRRTCGSSCWART